MKEMVIRVTRGVDDVMVFAFPVESNNDPSCEGKTCKFLRSAIDHLHANSGDMVTITLERGENVRG